MLDVRINGYTLAGGCSSLDVDNQLTATIMLSNQSYMPVARVLP